jgi:hypothetical protein
MISNPIQPVEFVLTGFGQRDVNAIKVRKFLPGCVEFNYKRLRSCPDNSLDST